MKKLFKKTSIKRFGKRIQKPFKAIYAKSPILALSVMVLSGVLILCGGSYGAYQLVTVTDETGRNSDVAHVDEIDLSTVPPSVEDGDNSEQKSDTKSSNDEDDSTQSGTVKTNELQSESETGSSSDEYSDSLVSTVYSVKLGGAEPVFGKSVSIRSSSGEKITYLQVSTSPSIATMSQSVDLGGMRAYESPVTDGTDQYVNSRDLSITQPDRTASGKTTLYVFAGYDIEPVAITVSWEPSPEYYNEKTGQSLVVNGNVETYTLNFRIVPNVYFGKPRLNFQIIGDSSSNWCGPGSIKSIETTYNGVRDFALTCIHTEPVCESPPCGLRSDPSFKVGVSAQTPGGYWIPSSTSMYYPFEI